MARYSAISHLVLFLFVKNALCKTIDLGYKEPTYTNSELYSTILQYNNSASPYLFQLTGISKNIGFFIVQAHSQYDNVTISYDHDLSNGNHINGTNIGLLFYPFVKKTFYLSNDQNNHNIFNILLSVHGYFKDAPVPGGCNMEFSIKEAPYLQLDHNDHIIHVYSSPPGLYDNTTCDLMSDKMTVNFYQMYFDEKDHSASTYFANIKRMMTVEDILLFGKKVPNVFGYGQMRRAFALYPDTGSVYAVLVTSGNYSAAYVPIHTYGCSIYSSCPYPKYIMTAMYIAAGFGLFLCAFGHYFFKTHIILMGFLSTAFVGFVVLGSFADNLSNDQIFYLTLTFGVIGGICWLSHWCCCLFPISIIVLDSICFGALVASIIYYSNSDWHQFFESTTNFWWGYIIVILVCQIVLTFAWHYCIILTCIFLGSFAIILPVDISIGSYLRYIFFDLIRRVTVDHFNTAIIIPPFQWRDIATTFAWLVLLLLSFRIQTLINRRSEPFPTQESFQCTRFCVLMSRSARRLLRKMLSCCRKEITPQPTEQSRLLGNENPNYNTAVIYPGQFVNPAVHPEVRTFPAFNPSAPYYYEQ